MDKSKDFEVRLAKLEKLGEEIRQTDVPLDKALKDFEDGVKLARGLEKDLEKVESRIDLLMNGPEAEPSKEKPELELFGSDGQ